MRGLQGSEPTTAQDIVLFLLGAGAVVHFKGKALKRGSALRPNDKKQTHPRGMRGLRGSDPTVAPSFELIVLYYCATVV